MKYPKIFREDASVLNASDRNRTEVPCELNGVHKFRRYMPQVIACFAKNLLIFQMGLILAFPIILITSLTDPHDTMLLTSSETTWIASISFICQPFGSIFSGLITEPIGRKYAMITVNIPLAIAWLLMYFAQEFSTMLLAFCLLGISVGLMEAPVFTYIGEVSEAPIRGILTAFAGIAFTFGMMFVFLLGAFESWRNVALVCCCIPWITAFAICFVPETPIWLLFKNRTNDAIRSLQWLRGWVPSAMVMDEFMSLQKYKVSVQSCYECETLQRTCTHGAPTFCEKMKDFVRRPTVLPFILLTFIFFNTQFCGLFAMRPYIAKILIVYRSPVEPKVVIVWLGALSILGNVILMVIIRACGKRPIALISMGITFISCFVLGAYGFIFLPTGTTSFYSIPTEDTSPMSMNTNPVSYIPLMSIYVLQFATSFVAATPNMLMCEIFPFKSRAFATGIAASTNYLWAFASTKLYYNFEMLMSLPGTIILFGFIGVLGFIGMYLFLPETEGRSLEDIELYFADKRRKFTDTNIAIASVRIPTKITVLHHVS